MATFEESFLYPLILLLVGPVITSLLIPWFTKKWEDRKKKLEIKVDIVSKMSESMGSQMGESIYSRKRIKDTLTDADEKALNEKLTKFASDAIIISIKLESYFSGTGIRERLNVYSVILNEYIYASFAYTLKDPTLIQSRRIS